MRPFRLRRALVPLVLLALVAGSCASDDGSVEAEGAGGEGTTTVLDGEAATTTAPPTTAPPTTEAPQRGAMGLYPERVYVPNSRADTVHVIDPHTCEVEKVHRVGRVPHHITPTWDLTRLLVFNTSGNSFSVIDPATAEIVDEIPVEDPYNLYYLPDGSQAIVVAERYRRLDFRDPNSWELIASVFVEPPGVDHLAFSRDASYLVASTEFSGFAVKVDIASHEIVEMLEVGGAPIDVVRDPHDDPIMYMANQALHGVHVLDTEAMVEIGFIPTGQGAHGILLSKDKTQIYVSNRLEGTISVIDLAGREVVETWDTGGSPDMGILNPNGDVMWIANRFHASVMAIDVATGEVLCRIPVDAGPHGLTYFPNEGVASIGHNGLMIDENGEIE